MSAKAKETDEPRGRARMRAEIVEATHGLHKIGVVSADELRKTTLAMLERDALPKVADLTPKEIVGVRESAGVSQAVMAGFFNVAVSTISQWERGERHPAARAFAAAAGLGRAQRRDHLVGGFQVAVHRTIGER